MSGTAGELVLRYDYDFMPKGILTRFIVAVNHLIADQNLVWKSGVILAREGSRARGRRRLSAAQDHRSCERRGFARAISDCGRSARRIHAAFRRLKYDKFLPCNCEVCQTRDEPFAYPLSELKDFAAQATKFSAVSVASSSMPPA